MSAAVVSDATTTRTRRAWRPERGVRTVMTPGWTRVGSAQSSDPCPHRHDLRVTGRRHGGPSRRAGVGCGCFDTAAAVLERADALAVPGSPLVGEIAELHIEEAAAAGEVDRAFGLAAAL